MMAEPSTPLMRQYHSIKTRYPHALVLFRLGDFYELFYEDAIAASRELQITLTSRNREKGEPMPMCGVPYHAAEGYIARLLRAGYKIAVCDQMEQAGPGKKLVRREVVRVITPGTATSLNVLEPKENNYLAALARGPSGNPVGLAHADITTGEFLVTEFSGSDAEEKLRDELHRLKPRESLLTRRPELSPSPGEVAKSPDKASRGEENIATQSKRASRSGRFALIMPSECCANSSELQLSTDSVLRGMPRPRRRRAPWCITCARRRR